MPIAGTANTNIDLILCQRKAYERHRKRVKSATSTIDMSPPKLIPHVLNDAKKLQLQKERQAQIVKDNFILLKHLQSIMSGSKKKKGFSLTEKKSECIRFY
ncbi:GSCOCG00008675001-RA-CDS [Cotesia congregata]|uniref:Similar to Cfap97d2: Uncharacterized protein CFAP97D2 (Mus musculus) n=1 Tax=Cotesia congregata TaxID=51543 RepID=A0A8J2HF60_COTCN|nr:GSCOCG00008675001-RA-CDS [Cotesia congregata]CAG5096549.1 Similar to Cfap97d2: Uncharacterized protein CFAP97D2 (Mus musculus) [Cotesia congregata]